LEAPLAGISGKRSLFRVLDFLERLRPAGKTNLEQAIRKFSHFKLRSGLAVVISDFFDPRGIEAVTRALGLLRHRLLLVQVAKESDLRPPVQGEVQLTDCESGQRVDITITPDVLERYQRAYREFSDGLMRFAVQRRAVHVRLDAERSVLEQLSGVFDHGTLTV
jgi:hypothetical protein